MQTLTVDVQAWNGLDKELGVVGDQRMFFTGDMQDGGAIIVWQPYSQMLLAISQQLVGRGLIRNYTLVFLTKK